MSRDYYTLPGESDEQRLRVEREFALLENRVAPLIRWLAECQPGGLEISDSDRDALAGYAAILHVRVPAARDAALARARAMAGDAESLGLTDPNEFLRSARAFGLVGTDEELEAKRAAMVRDLQAGRRRMEVHPAISLMGLAPAVEKVRPLLVGRAWVLLRTDGWPGYVLGDQPVTLLSRDRVAPQVGFGTPGVQVMMPLSSNTLLLISDGPRERRLEMKVERQRLGLAEPWWSTANKVAWLTAKRYVFARARGHLQATELLIPYEFRRRDLHLLSDAGALAAVRRSHARRRDTGASSKRRTRSA